MVKFKTKQRRAICPALQHKACAVWLTGALGAKVVASDVAPRPKRAMVYSHVAGDQALYEAVIHVFEEMKSTKSESSNISYGYYDEIVNIYDSLLNKDSN